MGSVFGTLTIVRLEDTDNGKVRVFGHFDHTPDKEIPIFTGPNWIREREVPFNLYYEDFYKEKEIVISDCLDHMYKGKRIPTLNIKY